MSVSDSSVQPIQVCPLCGSRAAPAPHGSGAAAIAQCTDCGLVMRHPQPSDATLRARLGAAARDDVRARFASPLVVARIAALYEMVLDGR